MYYLPFTSWDDSNSAIMHHLNIINDVHIDVLLDLLLLNLLLLILVLIRSMACTIVMIGQMGGRSADMCLLEPRGGDHVNGRPIGYRCRRYWRLGRDRTHWGLCRRKCTRTLCG